MSVVTFTGIDSVADVALATAALPIVFSEVVHQLTVPAGGGAV